MRYRVVIYCPDTHFYYTAPEIDRTGAGGGLMARIRLAEALSRRGHHVTMIAHVKRPHVFRKVRYLPLEDMREVSSTDILILMSTGGELSLEKAIKWDISSRLRLVWVQGYSWIQGVDVLEWDYIVVPSNYLLTRLQQEWPLQSNSKWWVFFNGAGFLRKSLFPPRRNQYRIIYAGHPSKGLESALSVLGYLREEDKRFHLWVFGGSRLWGKEEDGRFLAHKEEGVQYFGTQSQRRLYHAFQTSLASIVLQEREEPFGMVLVEAMMSGAIPIASPVGAFRELVQHGYNGLLVPGSYLSPATQKQAASWVLRLKESQILSSFLRSNAKKTPITWDTLASAWEGWWNWLLEGKGLVLNDGCPQCRGDVLSLADGYHCLSCGYYSKELAF